MFPHPTLPLVATGYGSACPGCGGIMQSFVCTGCGMPQYLMKLGSSSPATGNYAPVVQAKQGASHSMVKELFKVTVKSFASEAGTDLARSMFGGQYS
jgi:hypothetical protein